MSRKFLVLALVAMMLVSALAQQAPAHYKSKHYKHSKKVKKVCSREFPGCKTCRTLRNVGYTCVACKDRNAVFDSVYGECECKTGFGTFTQAEWDLYRTGENLRPSRRPVGCRDCSSYPNVVADEGVCVYEPPISPSDGRRLFSTEFA